MNEVKKKTRNWAIAGLCTAALSSAGIGVYLGIVQGEPAKVTTSEKNVQTKKNNNPFASTEKKIDPFNEAERAINNPFETAAGNAEKYQQLFQASTFAALDLEKEKEVALGQLTDLVKAKKAEKITVIAIHQPSNEKGSVKPTPIPEPIPVPTPVPNPEPSPTPTPEPTPNPEPEYEAHLSVPDTIRIHALSSFDIQSYAHATDESGNDISDRITSTSVDTTILGNQTIQVEVTNHGAIARTIMTVEVVNDAPQLFGLSSQTIPVTTSFDPLAGVQAVDTEEGDLTEAIRVEGNVDVEVPGEYALRYTVTDRFGEEEVQSITITVVAESPTFIGIVDTEIPVGAIFDPREGVQVEDIYGNIDYTVIGEVDTTVAGVYTLQYQAVNRYGVETNQMRQITVIE